MTSDELVTATAGTAGTAADTSVETATHRLTAELGGRVGSATVHRTVRACREELDGVPVAALPELVERLARQRLLQLVHLVHACRASLTAPPWMAPPS
jgi:hypothetical protein